MSIEIDRKTLALPDNQYRKTKTKKSLIVMHHTAGASEESSVRWWKMKPDRIATAFIIGREGDVYQCFDPEYWASHLGIGGAIEQRSIGIELANWGPLERAPGGRYVNYAGGRFDGQAADCAWRGKRYWEVYPEPQVQASIELVDYLTRRFDIPRDVAPQHLGAPDVKLYRAHKGVIAHHHVRADKSDVSPAYPWHRLADTIEGTATTLLELGSEGPRVAALQHQLTILGDYNGRIDSDFGEKTETAVKVFQKREGLKDDGVVGPKTMAAIIAKTRAGV